MTLPLRWPLSPMEALAATALPEGGGWVFEPKWDGFRCIAFKDGATVRLQSKAGQPLGRYFPEIVAALSTAPLPAAVLDGELVILRNGGLSFDDLLQRIHPADSRVRRLAAETPATFVLFDLLVDERRRSLLNHSFTERRAGLERLFASALAKDPHFRLSPQTPRLADARDWLDGMKDMLDGVVAKRREAPYETGLRTGAMTKIKNVRTADCVVGGFRYAARGGEVGSLLLGLFDDQGRLNHVGFTAAFEARERKRLRPLLEPLIRPPGFTGNAPGGPSRWSTKRSTEWQPLAPRLVVEVRYDHFTGGRFRHGTQFLRWRPDKAPEQCRLSQVRHESASPLALLERKAPRSTAGARTEQPQKNVRTAARRSGRSVIR